MLSPSTSFDAKRAHFQNGFSAKPGRRFGVLKRGALYRRAKTRTMLGVHSASAKAAKADGGGRPILGR